MRLLTISALIALLIDVATKYAVVHGMDLVRQRSIDVFPPLLRFIYGENRGINFGLGDGTSVWVLIGISVVISAAVLYWITRAKQPPLAMASAGMLIGGAMGNVVDRLWFGYVQDFLNMSCCGINNPFVFNVADIFIFAGAIGLVLFAKDAPKKNQA